MALANKFQQGGSTPALYNLYGQLYDYNELEKAADQGLSEYLSGIKRGDKDANEFKKAYSDIMSGIMDGTVTFDKGSFHDSKGRYTNSNEKNKDYYGIMAKYIYDKMGKINPYKKPETQPWNGTANVQKALMQEMFNSDSLNLQDFLDLDEEKNGVRGLKNRAAYLSNALNSLVTNWDTKFSGYSDEDKAKYATLLTNAANAIKDGVINPGDYLTLSKAVGGVDFRKMLDTGLSTTPTATTTSGSVSTGGTTSAPLGVTNTTDSTTFQTTSTKLRHTSLVDNNYNAESIERLTSIMSKVPTKGLLQILRNSFYNRNYRFGNDRRIRYLFKTNKISSRAGVSSVLHALLKQNKLKQADPSSPNVYYIPGLRTKRGTAWVWNSSSNQVAELKIQDIPYLKDKIKMNKLGGVLYAAAGATVPKTPDFAGYFGSDYDTANYKYEWGDLMYSMNDKGDFLTPRFGSKGVGYNPTRYGNDPNYPISPQGKLDVLNIENSTNYKALTQKILDDYDAWIKDKNAFTNKNNLFLQYTHGYDSQLSNDKLKFWNGDNLNTSWTTTGTGYYGDAGRTYNDPKEYIKLLRNDLIASYAHNNYRAYGKRYFYKDAQGNKHYVDPTKALNSNFRISNNPLKSTEGFVDWDDYEILGDWGGTPGTTTTPGALTTPENSNNGQTLVNPVDAKPKTSPFMDYLKAHGQDIKNNMIPLAGEAVRLGLSLNANKKIEDILRKGHTVGYYNPWEHYTPVTGDFGTKMAMANLAANIVRLSNKTFTSDSALNYSLWLEALRLALNAITQGNLADNKEIQRTSEIADANAKEGQQIRNTVANRNTDLLTQWKAKQAEIQSQRLQADYTSKDNFIANNFVAPAKEEQAYRKGLKRQEEQEKNKTNLNYDMKPFSAALDRQRQLLSNYYSREKAKILELLYAWQIKMQKEHAGDDSWNIYEAPEYQEFKNKMYALEDAESKDTYEMSRVLDALNRKIYDTIQLNVHSGTYNPTTFNVDYDDTVKNQNWYKILNGVKAARRGGILRPSTLYLLNKVIK